LLVASEVELVKLNDVERWRDGSVLAVPCDALPHGEFGDACYALFQILCLFGLAVSAQPHHAHPGSCTPLFYSLLFVNLSFSHSFF
jgi:hypothetical protein